MYKVIGGEGWNSSGDQNLLTAQGRHVNGAVVVGFVDGHVEVVRKENLSKLRWEP